MYVYVCSLSMVPFLRLPVESPSGVTRIEGLGWTLPLVCLRLAWAIAWATLRRPKEAETVSLEAIDPFGIPFLLLEERRFVGCPFGAFLGIAMPFLCRCRSSEAAPFGS